MKKFISFALTAAMVASLVPATAFAKTQEGDIYHGTVSVVNAWNDNKKFDGNVNKDETKPSYGVKNTPEAQIRITDVDYRGTDAEKVARFTLRLDNANFFDDAEVESDAARVKFNEGITVSLSPTGVGSGSAAPAVDDNYSYATKTVANLTTQFEKLYDAIKADGYATAGTNVAALKFGGNNGLYTIASGTPTWTGDSNGAGAAANKNVTRPSDLVALDGTILVGLLSGINSGGNLIANVPGSAAKPAMTAEDARNTAWTAYTGTGKPGNGKSAYVWTEDLGAVLKDGDATTNGYAGWYDDTDPVKAKSVRESVVAQVVKAALKADPADADYGTIPIEAVTDARFVDFAGKEEVATARQDKATWVALAKATAAGNLSTRTFYAEEYTKGKPAGTIYGQDRTGIKAEIESLKDMRKNEITVKVTNPVAGEGFLEKGDIISVDLTSILKNSSKDASFSITSSDIRLTNDNADFTYVNVDKETLVLSTRKVVDVAEDEVVTLDDKGLKIATNVGFFRTGEDNQVNLKISNGFEFVVKAINDGDDWDIVARKDGEIVPDAVTVITDDPKKTNKEEITFTVNSDVNEIVVYGIDVKATSAKVSKVATIRATSNGFNASTAVEVAKVVDYIVMLSVDEDEDVPVIYSGVDVKNTGLTDDSDHWSLEVTAEESFPGAWSFRKGFNFELPEHVFVADVEVISTENFLQSNANGAMDTSKEAETDEVFEAFFNAYQNGKHVNFEFDKRVFDDVDTKLNDEPASMTFKLQLVADTGFEGDVALKLTGELVDEQEVTIAKFVKPYEVKAEQNDMIIDYRYTEMPTAITITEAEAGLWDKDVAWFGFRMEKTDKTFFSFEDATFEVDSKSGMEIDDNIDKDAGLLRFDVDGESDEAATVTIKDIQLFMSRSIPAGPYDLSIESKLDEAYHDQVLFAPDYYDYNFDTEAACRAYMKSHEIEVKSGDDNYVGDVKDCTHTVKEGFVNVVTAGRDQDDASFTTKVVVPVGEDHIFAGEKEIKLDTPAYINEAGYTMLPIRAVAVALGINSNNVLWDQPTKTVTILYGQRIITMTQGQKVVYVNGSAIPASAAVENTNSRTFLPMRDLATALGVTDITWDQASRTATLNGNQK